MFILFPLRNFGFEENLINLFFYHAPYFVKHVPHQYLDLLDTSVGLIKTKGLFGFVIFFYSTELNSKLRILRSKKS